MSTAVTCTGWPHTGVTYMDTQCHVSGCSAEGAADHGAAADPVAPATADWLWLPNAAVAAAAAAAAAPGDAGGASNDAVLVRTLGPGSNGSKHGSKHHSVS